MVSGDIEREKIDSEPSHEIIFIKKSAYVFKCYLKLKNKCHFPLWWNVALTTCGINI